MFLELKLELEVLALRILSVYIVYTFNISIKRMKMSKSIELTTSQIKALENGATMLMFPVIQKDNKGDEYSLSIKNNYINGIIEKNYRIYRFKQPVKDFIAHEFEFQKGDKDVWVKEEFSDSRKDYDNKIKYKADDTKNKIQLCDWQPASQMTKEQSRYSIDCLDIRIVRPSEISKVGYFDGADINEDILKGLGLDWIGYFNRESYEEIGHGLFKDLYNQQMQECGLNRTYQGNDYIFLVEVKLNKKDANV